MKITQGKIAFRYLQEDIPVFEISLGNVDKVLNIGVALDRNAREMDSLTVADALRMIADRLTKTKTLESRGHFETIRTHDSEVTR